MADQVENLGDDELDEMAVVVDIPLEDLLRSDERPLTRALQRVLRATDRSEGNYAAFGNAP
jgi:FXSXX-COOH protein